jgi:hypothetical protein
VILWRCLSWQLFCNCQQQKQFSTARWSQENPKVRIRTFDFLFKPFGNWGDRCLRQIGTNYEPQSTVPRSNKSGPLLALQKRVDKEPAFCLFAQHFPSSRSHQYIKI